MNSTSSLGDLPTWMRISFFSVCTLFSLVGAYLNVVFLRTTYKTTLVTVFLRKLVRVFSMAHISFAVFTISTSAFASFFPNVDAFHSILSVFTIAKELCYASLFWILFERWLYHVNEACRDEPSPTTLYTARVFMLLLSCVPPAICCFYLKTLPNTTSNQYFSHSFFSWSHGSTFVVTLLITIILMWSIKRKLRGFKLANGLSQNDRLMKLKDERKLLSSLVLPICAVFGFFFAMEQICYSTQEIAESAFLSHIIILLYSMRIAIFPLILSIPDKVFREDFVGNFFVWKKARRRSSEARVRTIMNRESQDTIITNFKMLGIMPN